MPNQGTEQSLYEKMREDGFDCQQTILVALNISSSINPLCQAHKLAILAALLNGCS